MISLFKVLMAPEASKNVAATLHSGHIAQGPRVDEFEVLLGVAMELYPSQRVVTVNSCTSAIHLALALAGVQPGDDVAVTPMTCAATILPILHLGARPLWIDVNERTGLMDPASLDWRLTSNTSAIIAVDWAGVPCDYSAIHDVANGVPVIQDAAHAFLACDANPIGHRTRHARHFVCHSFQAIKHLTTGDGGALITPNELDERARKLRWFGFDRTSSQDFRCAQDLDEAGFKFHMNDVAASIGLANLPLAIAAVEKHRAHAKRYYEALTCLAPRVWAQPWHAGASWWIYTLLVDDREKFQAFMRKRDIETSQVHRRNDEHSVFKRAAGWHRELRSLDKFAKHQVSIPVGWWLSDQDVERVIDAVADYARS